MNPFDERLNRLLKAASGTPRLSDSPPFGMEARVIARVRSFHANGGDAALAFLRRALICASAVMILSLALSYRTLATPTSTEVTIANSAIEESLP